MRSAVGLPSCMGCSDSARPRGTGAGSLKAYEKGLVQSVVGEEGKRIPYVELPPARIGCQRPGKRTWSAAGHRRRRTSSVRRLEVARVEANVAFPSHFPMFIAQSSAYGSYSTLHSDHPVQCVYGSISVVCDTEEKLGN